MQLSSNSHINHHSPFIPGYVYHIFNKGINGETIFKSDRNRAFFLRRLFEYFGDYLEIMAWALLGNHFHVLARVREVNEDFLSAVREQNTAASRRFLRDVENFQNFLNLNEYVNLYLEDQFKRLFTSYAKAFNKEQGRYGSLFLKRFKRVRINDPAHVQNLIHYIHHNPVKHGFVERPEDWKYTSYGCIDTDGSAVYKPDALMHFFHQNEQLFRAFHRTNIDYQNIIDFIIEE